MRDLLPILKTLNKNKASPLLLILQIALTFTILVNAIYMMVLKEQELVQPTGLAENQLFSFRTNFEGSDEEKNAALDTDLASTGHFVEGGTVEGRVQRLRSKLSS